MESSEEVIAEEDTPVEEFDQVQAQLAKDEAGDSEDVSEDDTEDESEDEELDDSEDEDDSDEDDED